MFGSNAPFSKAHATCKPPMKSMNNIMWTPKELKMKCVNMTLHMDVVVIGRRVFLASTGKPVHCGDAQAMKSKKNKDFHEALDETVKQHNGAGFQTKEISCDDELGSLMEPAQDDMGIDSDTSVPGDHESVAERDDGMTEECH